MLCEERTIIDLTLHNIDNHFPLEDVLISCGSTLKRISLSSNKFLNLQNVLDHAPQVLELELLDVNPPRDFRWERLHSLEELTCTIGYNRLTWEPFKGLAHTNSRLHKLSLSELGKFPDLPAQAFRLCQVIRHRLDYFDCILPMSLTDDDIRELSR